MKRYAVSIFICVLTASAALAQTKSPLEGVWKITEIVTPATHPLAQGIERTQKSPQPSLLIFTKGYYSEVYLTGAPRAALEPVKDGQKLTDAEKIARYEQWRPLTANSGTYEIKEATLIKRAMVAKNVDVMSKAAPTTWELKFEGNDTVWLIPPPERAIEPRMKLTRLE